MLNKEADRELLHSPLNLQCMQCSS